MKYLKLVSPVLISALVVTFSYAQVFDFDCPEVYQDLRLGMVDDQISPMGQIASVQQFLKEYYSSLVYKVDGKFRLPTKTMVLMYQKDNGLVETGVVDLATRKKIGSMCNKSSQGSTGTSTTPVTLVPKTTQLASLAPSLDVQPNFSVIQPGQSQNLNITFSNMSTCVVVSDSFSKKIEEPSTLVVIPGKSTNYTFSCLGNDGSTVVKFATVKLTTDATNTPETDTTMSALLSNLQDIFGIRSVNAQDTTGNKLNVGTKVKTVMNLNTRRDPGLNSVVIVEVKKDSLGRVTDGPKYADQFVWWKVKWASTGIEGWTVEDLMAKTK